MKRTKRLTEEKVFQIINEEMSKSEISSLIASKIDSNMSSKDFEKKVKELAASVISELFKILWQRNSFWKDSVKR
jgi:dephospho-CoA kinase